MLSVFLISSTPEAILALFRFLDVTPCMNDSPASSGGNSILLDYSSLLPSAKAFCELIFIAEDTVARCSGLVDLLFCVNGAL